MESRDYLARDMVETAVLLRTELKGLAMLPPCGETKFGRQ